MNMPKPTPQHDRFDRLVGTWRGKETMHPMAWAPEGSSADGVMEARRGCGGLFFILDYVQLKGGQPNFTGHGVYGWDAAESCYTMHWFDSMTPGGFTKPVRGQWEGDVLAFTSTEPNVRYVYELKGADRLEFRIEQSQDGTTWKPFMEATYERA